MTVPFHTLGVDTSGHAGSLALLRDDELLEERSLAATGRRHARTLVAEVRALLQTFQVAPREVGLLAVSVGPGSFTGLRVGVVFAKTFGYATGIPLAAVDTFAVIAAGVPTEVQRVWVVEDAQRGALFAGLYSREARGEFSVAKEIEIVPEADLAGLARPGDVFVGPGTKRLPDSLRSTFRCLDESFAGPRGEHVARLGRRQFARGATVDPFALVPRYIRRSAAEEVAERKALSTGPAQP